jgi:MarR family transcriptional regulator, 2-MHQ and catechol-resistance regulon repressor
MPTHYEGDPKTVQALDTFIKFTRASSSLENRLFQRQDMLEDLTQSQFGVLETLYHLGSQCQGSISSKTLSSTGNMTLVVDNLEKRGLVRRSRDQADRRTVMVHLTEEGKTVIERVFPKVAAIIEEEFRVLTPEEQVTLGTLCKKLGKKTRSA